NETICGSVDQNEDMNDRQDLNRNEEKSKSMNEISSEAKDSETEEYNNGSSDEEMDDKSDTEKETKRRKHNKKTDGQFVCDFIGCGKNFATKGSVTQHKSVHLGHTYRCEECGVVFKSNCSLVKHKRIHLGETYRCDDCGTTYPSKLRLNGHKSAKHGTAYQCSHPGCDYKTGHKSALNKHRLNHVNDYQFKCGCDKAFKTQKYLNLHQKRVHPDSFADIPWIECSHTGCQYRSKCKRDIKTHIKEHTKPCICEICGKSIPSKNIATHRRTHNKSLQIPCEWPECERRFINNSFMRAHMNSHTCETTYRCQWPGCDNTYTNKLSLSVHQKRVHKGLLDQKCHWPECEYSTTNPIRLHNHIDRQHEGLQDYRCSHTGCDYTTTKCGQLDTHMKTHKN
ncbi:unnamed protein product, partial [Medioppia subpectinata]